MRTFSKTVSVLLALVMVLGTVTIFPVTVSAVGGYTVTVAASDHGNVSADKTQNVQEGETVTLTTSATDSHYMLRTLTVMQGDTAVETTAGENGTYTFEMPAGDVTVTASFEAYFQLFFHRVPSSFYYPHIAAITRPDGDIAFCSDDYVTVEVTPEAGYRIKSGFPIVDDADFNDYITVEKVSDTVCRVSCSQPGNVGYFEAEAEVIPTFNLNLTVMNASYGTTEVRANGVALQPSSNSSGTLSYSIVENSELTVTFTASQYAHLTEVTVTNTVQTLDGDTFTYTVPAMNSALSFYVTFSPIKFFVSPDPDETDVSFYLINSSGYAVGERVTFEAAKGGANVTEAYYTYTVDGQKITEEASWDNINNKWYFTMPASDVTLSASYEVIEYNIGTAYAFEGYSAYLPAGAEVTFEILVNGVLGTTANYNDEITVTATVNLPQCYITSISPKGPGGDTSYLLPTQYFNNWNTSETATFTMPSYDVTVKASFYVRTYPLWLGDYDSDSVVSIDSGELYRPAGDKVETEVVPEEEYDLMSVGYSYVLDGVEYNEDAVLNTETGKYEFTMPAATVTVTPVLQRRTYAITVSHDPQANDVFLTGTREAYRAAKDDDVIISVRNGVGYAWDVVTVTDSHGEIIARFDHADRPGSLSFTMPAEPVTVTVHAKMYHTVSIAEGSDNYLLIYPYKYTEGMTVTVQVTTFTIPEGHRFDGLLITSGETQIEATEVEDERSGYKTFEFTMPDGDVTVSVLKDHYRYTLRVLTGTNTYDFWVSGAGSKGGNNYGASRGDVVTVGAKRAIADDEQYVWTVTNHVTGAPIDFTPNGDQAKSISFTMPASDADVSFAVAPMPLHGIIIDDALTDVVETDKEIAGEGKSVTLSAPIDFEGKLYYNYVLNDHSYSYPVANQGDGTWTFTVPESDTDVTVIAATAESVAKDTPVSYVERSLNGTSVMTRNATTQGLYYSLSDVTTLGDGWYVLDSNVTMSGRLNVTGTANLILCDGMTLDVKDGVIIAPDATLYIYAQFAGTGKLVSHAKRTAGIGASYNKKAGTLYICGGVIDALGDELNAGIGGANGSKSAFTDINILGGVITAEGGDKAAGIGKGYENDGANCGEIRIYGGKVTAQAGPYGAGIGGSEHRSGCTVRIYGGEVSALTDNYYGAGIGGGDEGNGGTIEICGGSVYAEGSIYGAAIGSGDEASSCGNITISGGTVTVKSIIGAGIGGGNEAGSGNITITGGTITVETKGGGAGIGSGADGDFCGTIRITGGNVKSTTDSGAAIGSGSGSNMTGTIEITGGTVRAKAEHGAGIGAGYEDLLGDGGECEGTVRITGGTVTASTRNDVEIIPGSTYGVAIGYGSGGSTNGTLELGDNMMVRSSSSKNGSNLKDRGRDERGSGCHSIYCVVKPCSHQSINYTMQDPPENGHVAECAYCLNSVNHAHTLDSSNTCTACGYHEGRTWTVTLLSNNVAAESSSASIVYGATYSLPACSFTAAEGNRFIGWQKVENGQGVGDTLAPGTKVSGDADVSYRALWQTYYAITVNNPAANLPGSVNTSPADYAFAGDTVKIGVRSVDDGYFLDSVTVTDANDNPVAVSADLTFTMPASAVTLTPAFSHTHSYKYKNWTWTDDGNGNYSASLTLECEYCGDEQTVAGTLSSPEGVTNILVATAEFDGVTYTDHYRTNFTWQELQEQIFAEDKIVLTRDVIASETDSALIVPSGTEVTIDLNGHKIDRNLSEPTSGGSVFMVYGELYIEDSAGGGLITGGNTTEQGGGVYIDKWGDFTLDGGTISGNNASGTGVNGKGGGVYVGDGKMKMTGGSITGNTAQTEGAGVYLLIDGILYIGNDLNITNNKKQGEENNVSLGRGAEIWVYSLSDTARIGVTVKKKTAAFTDRCQTLDTVFATTENFISDNPLYDVVETYDHKMILEEREFNCGVFMGAAADSSKTRADLYFTIPDGTDPADFTVTINGDDPVSLGTVTPDANGYKFSITKPAKNMGDKISYTIKYNGFTVKAGSASIADYAENLAVYYPEYEEFVDAMLAYGAAAQNYFGYNADNPVSDADLTALAPVTGDAFDGAAMQADMIADAAIPVHYSAMNVTFLADTTLSLALRIKDGFTNDEAVEWVEANVTLDGEAVTASIKESGSYRFVIVSKQNIALDAICEPMALAVNGAGTYYVSVLNYLVAAEQTDKNDLKYLTRALYAYSQAAIAIKG